MELSLSLPSLFREFPTSRCLLGGPRNTLDSVLWVFGPFQTSNFTCAESNANEKNLLFSLICIRFSTCKVPLLKRTFGYMCTSSLSEVPVFLLNQAIDVQNLLNFLLKTVGQMFDSFKRASVR